MEVIILAGGFGTRLRSVVNEVPKCMAPIANKPFLWYLLKYLTKFDVSKVILSLGAKKPASPQNAAAPKIASATKAMIINLIIFPIHKPRFS